MRLVCAKNRFWRGRTSPFYALFTYFRGKEENLEFWRFKIADLIGKKSTIYINITKLGGNELNEEEYF